MKFRESYKFEKNDKGGDVPLMEVGEIEKEDVSLEDAPIKEEEEIEHELDESLSIINFTSCMSSCSTFSM